MQLPRFKIFLLAAPWLYVSPLYSAPPPKAAAVGFTQNTFSSAFTTATVDLNNTQAPGFKWYCSKFYGFAPTIISGGAQTVEIVLNGDSSATVKNNFTRNYERFTYKS
ncbi:MAG: hypothetical protein PHC61_13160, partial [Chitinivibrionales bacterium]|nr:hypothetical protein [Chitinivibrionales bacterium]